MLFISVLCCVCWDGLQEAEVDSDGDEIESEPMGGSGLQIDVLREISMLRYLNGAHPNVIRMHDASYLDNEDGVPAFTMIMPKAAGSLGGAIEDKTLKGSVKMTIAALLLHALDWMVSHNVMHRDIKPDNVLLDASNNPVLCDFSLAKIVDPARACTVSAPMAEESGAADASGFKKKKIKKKAAAANPFHLHTAEMGTPTYIAPEVVNGRTDYGTQADVWGVVFYEMFNNQMLTAQKDRQALAQIEEIKTKFNEKKPIPAMLKAMLDTEPGSRATAKSALRMLPGTEKVSFPTPGAVVDLDRIDAAFPAPAQKKKANGKEFTPTRACDILDAAHPFTARAAESYFRRSKSAQAVGAEGAAACAMLAAKSFEFESHHPSELYDAYPALGDYDDYEFKERELSILEDLDYCLNQVVFILGPPGSGKGTQCGKLVEKYGYVHLSAGDLLRAERKSGSAEGKWECATINKIIDSGALVPSHITVGLLKKAMESSPATLFLIDGFPRGQENVD
eukprot:gene2009-32441_t